MLCGGGFLVFDLYCAVAVVVVVVGDGEMGWWW